MTTSRRLFIVLLVLGLCAHLVSVDCVFADEDDGPTGPDAGAPYDADLGDITELGPIDVIAPRIYGGPAGPEGDVESTTLRRQASLFDVPAAVSTLLRDDIRIRRQARSLSDALAGLPSVMVQKTGPLQHSPYIRGFTGYQNLLLIDGIRLNHSAFRAGPNQYWSTVDPLSIDRLELTRGPHSVLYGSDAVGGTVNALPWRRTSFDPGLHVNGGAYLRTGSADGASVFRAETEGNKGSLGWAAGYSYKVYHDIHSGGGLLPNTGGIHEGDADMRVDWGLGRGFWLTVGWQHVEQFDAPRTEKTVYGVPFHGTAVGNELRRDFDQQRDLVYARLGFDGGARCWLSNGQLTVSWQRHDEERDRKRTGGRRDLSGFTVNQMGLALQLESRSRLGRWVYGFDYYRDAVDSSYDAFLNGTFIGSRVQGSVGDDATYDLLGAYVQVEIELGRLDLIPGARFTYARADAKRVDNPEVPGTDPNTPGNVISVDGDWTNVVGSLRAVYHLHPSWNVYGAASQAFRAPSLHDLTSLESTSVVETPAPDLDAEQYVSFELGLKHESRRWRADAAAWYTVLDDTIVRSPTGGQIDGVPEVRKDNVGDGHAWGVELEAAYAWNDCWTAFGNLSWMEGQVDQFDENDVLQRRWLSRMNPLTTLLGIRYEPTWSRVWAQADWRHAESEGRLSFRDEGDTRRIPPGGTPGWDVFSLRAGYRIGRATNVSLSVENLFDTNYRTHGSGQNEPGLNVVLAVDVQF